MVDLLINPLFQFKMPLLDGLVAPTALSNPQTMSNYLEKQTPHYTEAYFHYDPRAKEGSQFTPPWNSSKTSLLDGRGSTSHLASMDGKQHVFFRQNSNSSTEGAAVLSTLHAAPVKQGFTLYTKSPGVSSSTTTVPSVAVSKPRSAENDSTPQPGSPVYLAVPKPVYGHNPCCGELCCVRGRYSVESGYARMPHTVYKHNWMQSDAEYSESAEVQKKAKEALLQRRGLQFDAGVERMKRMETCSPGRGKPLPSIINPNYSRYPCTFFGSFGEQSQQPPPRGYPNLFPSHHAYEHMTSEVYQEHSPMTKYGHVTQRPVFYYTQADVEVENRSQCKNNGIKPGEDSPVAVKHVLPSPQEHFLMPRSLHSEATLPHFQHGALLQGFGYPCYGGPRLNVGVRQRVQPPPVVHSNNVHFSPTNLCPDYHLASATSLHEDSGSLGDSRSGANSSFFRVEQSNPPRYSNQPFVATSGVAVNRLFHSPSSLNRPGLQTPGLNVERFLSFSPSGGQVRCPKLPSIHPISLVSQLQPSLHYYLDQSNKAAHDQSNVQTNIKTESKPNDTISCLSSLKRSNSQSSPPIKVKEETDLIEDEPLKKCKKMEEMTTSVRNATRSPPMPVIDTVFSLAPYQVHIQSSGVLHPGRTLHSAVLLENPAVQMQPLVWDERKSQSVNRPVCRDSKEDCVGSPAQKPLEEIRKPQDIKVEKEDFAENSVEQQGCPTTAGGQHSEEMAASSIESLVVIKKCDPEELEMKPLVDNAEMSDKPTPDERPMKASPQSCAEDTCQQKPKVPSEPTEHRANYQNGLPCRKLATSNTVVPRAKCLSPAQAPNKPPVPPTTQDVPNLDVHLRVRKHFYELHHSLYKLISKSVFTTSEQELRSLLSQLELTEIAYPSSKIKNMPSLLGVKPRELWFNEEVKSVFKELLKRLQEYTAQARCPFPHVMRTSTVFLPMLVLKELLFPMVQSSFIDQVLQEHKVELRPTTLSEEKILLQLHKRACSSRLRRLMSLKHLPDIYADLINILYYTCISKHLGLDADNPAARVKDEVFEVTIGKAPVSPTSPASPTEFCSLRPLKTSKGESTEATNKTKSRIKTSKGESTEATNKTKSRIKTSKGESTEATNKTKSRIKTSKGESTEATNKTKSRIKHSSRRLFLDESLTDEEKVDEINGGVTVTRGGDDASGPGDGRSDSVDAERDAPASVTFDNSWMRPLDFEEVSPIDAEAHTASSLLPRSTAAAKPAAGAKNGSGMILKLRRMFGTNLNRKKARYQAISDRPLSQTEDSEVDIRAPKLTHRRQRKQSFCRAVRPIGSSSKRPLLKIKYCPYLSTYGAEHRRGWILRSAVQRARSIHYPDLVGKTIHHLYEEDDKSEVWYRGEVLRVHEAHANPLKTIFEVRYDGEPEWRYYLELLIDYKKGWLKIED